jgi:hypothetical protein
MNTHKHARLTFVRRIEMVKQMTLRGWDAVRAAAAHGVTAPPKPHLQCSLHSVPCPSALARLGSDTGSRVEGSGGRFINLDQRLDRAQQLRLGACARKALKLLSRMGP